MEKTVKSCKCQNGKSGETNSDFPILKTPIINNVYTKFDENLTKIAIKFKTTTSQSL